MIISEEARKDELAITQQLFDNIDYLKEMCAILETQRDIARTKLKRLENFYENNQYRCLGDDLQTCHDDMVDVVHYSCDLLNVGEMKP